VIALVCPLDTFFSDSIEFRCTLFVLAKKPPILCCALLAQPKELRIIFQLKKDRELYLPTEDETYHTPTTYIHETHKQSYVGKTLVLFINMKI